MIELLTAETPNGRKISIMLEELGLKYNVHKIDLSAKQQKEDWFLQRNPNGRIPVIIDKANDDFTVFESGAILYYLAERSEEFIPKTLDGKTQVMQWLMFQMAGIGPMQGQANVFYRYTPEKISYAIERYCNETRRLYEVLDHRLGDVEFLAGEYSIADIATYPWVAGHDWSNVSVDGLEHLQRWMATMAARPAVAKGMEIPTSADSSTDEKINSVQHFLD